MISVLILTKNEEADLPACLASVNWCDDIHVFDSFSTDRTVEIAKMAGATVTQRQFDGYSSQRNAALDQPEYKNKWLLILDADERLPSSLVPELQQQVWGSEEDVNGFRLRRRDYLGKTWLKHAQISPFYIRLIRLGKARYHREINEVLLVEGKVVQLSGHFDHYPFSKGYAHWIYKHNQYSGMESVQFVKEMKGLVKYSVKKALFSPDVTEKRYHQKGLFYRMPFRPVVKWCYIVFWRCAFMDGRAGIIYATLQAIYEYFIVLKSDELIEKVKTDMGTGSNANLKYRLVD